MPAKASAAKTGATKKSSSVSEHPPYKEMIKESIRALKERNGSSRPALKKYIQANYKGVATDRFDQLFNQALKKGAENNEFAFPKGPSGTVKLVKKEPAPKAKPVAKDTTKKTAAKDSAKKPAAKKAAAKKTAAPKKEKVVKEKEAAPKKEKAAPKEAAKPKSNAKKPRKTAAPAPAVTEKSPVLTKTKSGRVSKGSATTAKAAPKKKAAPRKKATPKKKEAPAAEA